jgi:hypothetical protein
MHIEPIEVVQAADTSAFINALKRTIAKGNPVVPTPLRSEYGKPAVLKYANVSSWKRFEAGLRDYERVRHHHRRIGLLPLGRRAAAHGE